MAAINYGVCRLCRRRVPVTHVVRDGKVYVAKDCPDCGANESLVSTDAAAWQQKRDICQYEPDPINECTLHCETCHRDHEPAMVFLEVTNRCNMNCPICIANIQSMGFEFHPPLSYFENVLSGLAAMKRPPLVQLFGGEPTVRDDLLEIIKMGRDKGLDMRVVTNGLRLADEEYCRQLCESKVHVLFAFDGRSPEIYQRLRKSSSAYEKKLQALENLKKHSRRKNTIMCCVARGVNDQHMADLIEYCHENRAFIKCMHLLPLAEPWDEGQMEPGIATTIEDVEKIIAEAMPDEPVEFLSAGLSLHLRRASQFFGLAGRMKFGGVHPNCETAMFLLSDGTRYVPLGHYLKRPLSEITAEVVRRAKKIDAKLARLDPGKPLQRLRGRMLLLRTFGGLLLGSVALRKVLRGNSVWATLAILGGLLVGKKAKKLLRRHTRVHEVMLMIVLPFEEFHSIESERLQHCFAGFAFEDPDTGKLRTMSACTWGLYRNDLLRKLAAKYSVGAPAS